MKNQVENNQQERKRIVVPLGQTIFLPQTAMGVSYIDKVRTKVYLDTVQPQGDAVCMRGFYEIDLEYHGLEGNRLYKHRVMLPLCVELPAEWNYEPEELHVVITKPMLRILSPYVLEFAAGLATEYVGERLYRENKPKNEKSEVMSQEKTLQETEVRQRLESKFGSPDNPKSFKKPDYHLPVWSEQKNEQPPEVKPAAAEKKPAAKRPEKTPVIKTDQNKLRSMLTVAAISRLQARGEVLAEKTQNEVQEVILLSPPQAEGKLDLPVNVQVAADAEPVTAKVEPPPAEPAEPVTAKAEPSQAEPVEPVAVKAEQSPAEPAEPAEPVTAQSELPQTEPVSAKTEPPQTEPVSAKAELPQVEPVSAKAELPQVEPVSAKAEQPPAEPVAAKVEQPQAEPAEPVLKTERSVEQTVTGENKPEVIETEAETPAVETAAEAETAAVEVMSDNVAEEKAVEAAVTPEDLAADLAAEISAAAVEADDGEAAVETAAMESGPEEIKTAGLTNADGVRLRVGLREAQRVRPVPKAAAAEGAEEQKSSSFCLKYYVVKPGDDPMSIALKHNVPLERLRESNKALAGDLSVGTVLRIPC